MRDRRQELTTEVTERLRRVCAHLPPELFATVAHRIVETTVKYEQRPPGGSWIPRVPPPTR